MQLVVNWSPLVFSTAASAGAVMSQQLEEEKSLFLHVKIYPGDFVFQPAIILISRNIYFGGIMVSVTLRVKCAI